jgi:hypothetical protein
MSGGRQIGREGSGVVKFAFQLPCNHSKKLEKWVPGNFICARANKAGHLLEEIAINKGVMRISEQAPDLGIVADLYAKRRRSHAPLSARGRPPNRQSEVVASLR